MIPFIQLPELPFKPFGLLITLGILLGRWMILRQRPVEERAQGDSFLLGVMGGALLGSHLVELFFYHPERLRDPRALYRFWVGFSSIGGFAGAALVFFPLSRRLGLNRLAWGDALLKGGLWGWLLGRAACALVHDHPGCLSDFPLAVAFPGGARHDLGLYELFLTLSLMILIRPVREPPGRATALLIILYGSARFLLDFLRAWDLPHSDPRWWGLTGAQYACLLALPLGFVLLRHSRGLGRS